MEDYVTECYTFRDQFVGMCLENNILNPAAITGLVHALAVVIVTTAINSADPNSKVMEGTDVAMEQLANAIPAYLAHAAAGNVTVCEAGGGNG